MLNGAENITMNVGDNYAEQGAKATDDKDGDLTDSIMISGAVNTSKAGTYTVTYTVKDSNGNTSTKKRTIIVKGKEPSESNSKVDNTVTNEIVDKTPNKDENKEKDKEKDKENNTINSETEED